MSVCIEWRWEQTGDCMALCVQQGCPIDLWSSPGVKTYHPSPAAYNHILTWWLTWPFQGLITLNSLPNSQGLLNPSQLHLFRPFQSAFILLITRFNSGCLEWPAVRLRYHRILRWSQSICAYMHNILIPFIIYTWPCLVRMGSLELVSTQSMGKAWHPVGIDPPAPITTLSNYTPIRPNIYKAAWK